MYNDQNGQTSNPVKSIKRNDLLIDFAPYLEIGWRLKSGSNHLNVQPIGVMFSTHGIGVEAARTGLIVQF